MFFHDQKMCLGFDFIGSGVELFGRLCKKSGADSWKALEISLDFPCFPIWGIVLGKAFERLFAVTKKYFTKYDLIL